MGILPQYGVLFYTIFTHLSMNNFHNSGVIDPDFLFVPHESAHSCSRIKIKTFFFGDMC